MKSPSCFVFPAGSLLYFLRSKSSKFRLRHVFEFGICLFGCKLLHMKQKGELHLGLKSVEENSAVCKLNVELLGLTFNSIL